MPCYDGGSNSREYDDGYSYGKSAGESNGYSKGYADAKKRYESPNVIKLEGEFNENIDRLNNQIVDMHKKNRQLLESIDKLEKEKDRNDKLEASLCALITELEKRDIANDIISQASRSGLIDLMKFWEDHKQEDETRLANKIHRMFSEHEQEVIKNLLNKRK